MVELEKVGVENTCPVILHYFSRSTQLIYTAIISSNNYNSSIGRTSGGAHVAEPSKAPYPP
jgi:hypothetical protein